VPSHGDLGGLLERCEAVIDLLERWQDAFFAALPQEVASPPLTAREREVVEHVLAGESNAEIAAALGMSEKTVKTHLTHVYAKVGVRSRTELTVRLGAAPRTVAA